MNFKIKMYTLPLIMILQGLPLIAEFPRKMIVSVSVADLRSEPQASSADLTLPTSDLTNPLQMTQLLLGEHVCVHDEYINFDSSKWFKVNALQQEYYHIPVGWHGFPGWIQAHQLIEVEDYPSCNLVVCKQLANIFDKAGKIIQVISIGTRLNGTQRTNDLWEIILPDNQVAFINNVDVYFIDPFIGESNIMLQQSIVATAMQFVGSFYSWGGRSAQCDQFGISSVDCSALIHLSFLAHGLQIPRMSHEQFLQSERIEHGYDLQPGDLIFFVSIKKRSSRMDHVMLYLGDNQILEATFAEEHKVRCIPSQQRLGKLCENIESGDIIDDTFDQYYIYFGSFFRDKALTQELRDNALRHTYLDILR